MAIPYWPGSVPFQPRLDSYKGVKPFADPAVNQVEDGPAIQRRWASSNWAKIPYEIVLTRSQSDAFFVFVRDTLGHGASRFYIQLGRRLDSTWPYKVAYITGGSIRGPDPYGSTHFLWAFELNVLDY